jgi:membrane protease YdiL (CAAX protease family)
MAVEPTFESDDIPVIPTLEHEREPGFRLSASRGLGYFILYVGAQLLLGLLGGVAIAIHHVATGGDPADSKAIQEIAVRFQGLIGIIAALIGGFIFAAFVLLKHRGAHWTSFRKAIGLMPANAKQITAGACAGIAIGLAYVVLASSLVAPARDITPGPLTQMALSPGIQQQTWTWFALLGSPVVEEFVVRGVLLACFVASWGVVWASIITTILFVGMHYSEIMAFWPAALSLAAMSFAVAALRIRTASLLPAICGHLAYNAVLVIVVRFGSSERSG